MENNTIGRLTRGTEVRERIKTVHVKILETSVVRGPVLERPLEVRIVHFGFEKLNHKFREISDRS